MIKRPRLLFAVLALALATLGLGRSFAAQNRRGAPAAPVNEIEVVSATFGAGRRVADVTAKVAQLVRPNGGLVKVNAATLGGDPAPGAKKQLTITYKYHGGTYTYTAAAGQTFYYSNVVTNAKNGTPQPVLMETQVLSPEQMAAIVIIEGDKGVGTGFLARVNGVLSVVTNLHVLGDNERIAIKTLRGETVAWQGILGAVGADIALLRVTDPAAAPAPLELAADVAKIARLGAKVVVAGNRLGGGVVTQTSGQVKGIGPARVEVDAFFQPGNSGSPILDVETKQVLGVATYTSAGLTALNGAGTLRRETRWFGFRLDTVAKWQPIDWKRWQAQMKQVGDFNDTSMAIMEVLFGPVAATQVELPDLRRIIRPFDSMLARIDKATKAAPPAAADLNQLRAMFGQVRTFAERDAKALLKTEYYDFFQTADYADTNLRQQTELRDELIKALKAAENKAEFQSLQAEIE